VYAITPETGAAEGSLALVEAIAGLLAAGHLVQLRQKRWSARELAEASKAVASRVDVGMLGRLLINDRCDVALSVAGAGVHLPEAGLPIAVARALVGPGRLLGVSCHDAGRLDEATRHGADLATLSPIHETPGKGVPLGLDGLSRLVRTVEIPIYALGGIGLSSVGPVAGSGAAGIACIRAVFDADDPAAAATLLSRTFEAHRPASTCGSPGRTASDEPLRRSERCGDPREDVD
jgi:thiamine-phosphate diphosphorylase